MTSMPAIVEILKWKACIDLSVFITTKRSVLLNVADVQDTLVPLTSKASHLCSKVCVPCPYLSSYFFLFCARGIIDIVN
jgi:hypothetical protein